MTHEEFTTMPQVSTALNSILQTLEARDTLDAERRKTDDAREIHAVADRKELLDRVDAHGIRTTRLESRWEAFFGPEGAFQSVLNRGISQGKKIDKLSWLVGIGGGVGATLAFILLLRK